MFSLTLLVNILRDVHFTEPLSILWTYHTHTVLFIFITALLKCKSHALKFIFFKVYNSVNFSAFKYLVEQVTSPNSKHISDPKRHTSYLWAVSLLRHRHIQRHICARLYDFQIPVFQINRSLACDVWWLLVSSLIFSEIIHVASVCASFFLWTNDNLSPLCPCHHFNAFNNL